MMNFLNCVKEQVHYIIKGSELKSPIGFFFNLCFMKKGQEAEQNERVPSRLGQMVPKKRGYGICEKSSLFYHEKNNEKRIKKFSSKQSILIVNCICYNKNIQYGY